MGFFNIFRSKSSKVLGRHAAIHQYEGVFSERNYRVFSIEGFRQNNVVHRCVKLIMKSISSIPLVLAKKTRDGEIETINDHPILNTLNAPNPMQGYRQLMESLSAFLNIDGNSYVEIDQVGKTIQLYALMPNLIRPKPGTQGIPLGYEMILSQDMFFPVDQITGASDIIHIKEFDPLSLYTGYSPLGASGGQVDTHNAMTKWNLGILQNSGRLSGIITVDKDITKGQTGYLGSPAKRSIKRKNREIHGPKQFRQS